MPLDGRWTILKGGAFERVIGPDTVDAGSLSMPLPVVPCDDAAVERVAAKLAEIQGYHAGPLEIDRRSARDLLRAAAGR